MSPNKTPQVCTIGDCYVATAEVGGCLSGDSSSSDRDGATEEEMLQQRTKSVIAMLKFSLGLLEIIAQTSAQLETHFSMRIGLHIGKFIGGVLGKKKLRYDIWGEDVHITNLIESNGIPGAVCASEPLREFCTEELPGVFDFVFHREIPLKNARTITSYVMTRTWEWEEY